MSNPQVLVPLATGFEEIEAITLIDVLRRAGIHVTVAGLTEGPIEASRGTRHLADVLLDQILSESFDAIILPGGLPGTLHLKAHPGLRKMIESHALEGKWIGAICAAPTVLQDLGLLNGKRATSHPGSQDQMKGVRYSEDRVVVDGTIVTSRAAGTAMEFSLKLVELMMGRDKMLEVNRGLLANVE